MGSGIILPERERFQYLKYPSKCQIHKIADEEVGD